MESFGIDFCDDCCDNDGYLNEFTLTLSDLFIFLMISKYSLPSYLGLACAPVAIFSRFLCSSSYLFSIYTFFDSSILGWYFSFRDCLKFSWRCCMSSILRFLASSWPKMSASSSSRSLVNRSDLAGGSYLQLTSESFLSLDLYRVFSAYCF